MAVTYEMLESKAYRKLSGSALKALLLCLRKVKTYDPIDRFKFHFSLTYPEAKKLGFCNASFFRGMKLLRKLGFIDFIQPGGLRFEHKASSLYRLSQRWKKYGTPGFQEVRDGYYEGINDEDVF